MICNDDLNALVESWLNEVRVVRRKRVPTAVRNKRRRYYRKRKAQIRRLAKVRRRKPSVKRRAKRLATVKKRMKIKPGSRKVIHLSNDRTGNIVERRDLMEKNVKQVKEGIDKMLGGTKIQETSLATVFKNVSLLAENLHKEFSSRKLVFEETDILTVWSEGPNSEGVYSTDTEGDKKVEKKTFTDRMNLENYLRDKKAQGYRILWRHTEEQSAYDMTESKQLSENVAYVTLDGQDYEYVNSEQHAMTIAKKLLDQNPQANVKIEIFSGKEHGSGGTLIKTLVNKEGAMVKEDIAEASPIVVDEPELPEEQPQAVEQPKDDLDAFVTNGPETAEITAGDSTVEVPQDLKDLFAYNVYDDGSENDRYTAVVRDNYGKLYFYKLNDNPGDEASGVNQFIGTEADGYTEGPQLGVMVVEIPDGLKTAIESRLKEMKELNQDHPTESVDMYKSILSEMVK